MPSGAYCPAWRQSSILGNHKWKRVRAPTGCPLTSITMSWHTCTVPTTLPILRGKKGHCKGQYAIQSQHAGQGQGWAGTGRKIRQVCFWPVSHVTQQEWLGAALGYSKDVKLPCQKQHTGWGLSGQLDSLLPPSLLTCHQPQLLWLPFSHQSSLFSHHCKSVENGWDLTS